MLLHLRLRRPLLDGLMMDAIPSHHSPGRLSLLFSTPPGPSFEIVSVVFRRRLYFGIIILILQTLKHLIFALVLAANLSEREIP